jgi:thiamine biosynthesis lipoprotein
VRRTAAALGLVASLVSVASAQIHYVMGTFLRVVVDDDVPPAAFDGCFARARALDRTFSRFDPTSELTRLHATGGGPASDDLRSVLRHAVALARATEGTFDVSAGAVTALWRRPTLPSAVEIRAARGTVGRVAIEGDRIVVAPGTQLDFDGFVKGVAVDACVAALRAAGVTRALVSFGESSLYALGAPRGVGAWSLDVRGADPDLVVARLALRDRAAAVSAVFGGGGRRASQRGHVVDPRTLRPLDEDAASVVTASSAADAEAGEGRPRCRRVGHGRGRARRRRAGGALRRRRRGGRPGHARRAHAAGPRQAPPPGRRGGAPMKAFSNPAYMLANARLEVRLAYTGFALVVIGFATIAVLELGTSGRYPATSRSTSAAASATVRWSSKAFRELVG